MLARQHPDFRWTLTAWSEFDPESSRPLDQQPAVVAHRLCFPNAGPNLGDMTRIDWQDFMQNPQKYYDDERERTEGESDARANGQGANGTEHGQARMCSDADNGSPLCGQHHASETGLQGNGSPDRIQVGSIDLLTYSTPCQSISQAGKREGMAKGSGTRSSVLWSTADAIEALRPKMLLQENVRAIINQQNIRHFRQWMQTVSDLGYENFLAPSFTLPGGERTTASILNARDYGIPQNRDRMFLVSIRKDLLRGTQYEFPRPFPLTQCIADVLEPDASPALYLKPESVTSFLQKNEDGQQQYIYATVSHRPTSTQIEAMIAENEVRVG
jgi:DNA (cytosine-5)-methyltransferase 1